MNCNSFEQLIALYVEDDLQESDRIRVEAHLRGCANCRAVSADLQESQSVFKSLREGMPSTAALTSVREGVLSRVDAGRSAVGWPLWLERFVFGGVRRKVALASIALFLLAVGAVYDRPSFVPEPTSVATVAPPVVPVEPEVAVAVASPKVKRVRRAAPVPVQKTEPAKEPTTEPLMVKFLTDDPNIIIYWLIDEQGE